MRVNMISFVFTSEKLSVVRSKVAAGTHDVPTLIKNGALLTLTIMYKMSLNKFVSSIGCQLSFL